MGAETTPRVSVVIPTYNSDRYIVEAIESVLNQTYSDYEIIVVDDGSTDRLLEVLEPYRDRIRYLYQDNQGLSVARNTGIRHAQGEFVALLDADDFFLPDKFAHQVVCFDAQPDVGIVHSGWQFVDESGRQVLSEHEPWCVLPHLNLQAWLLWRPLLPSAMMFRRDWLERVGGFDPDRPPVEDVDLVLRMVAIGCQSAWLRQITVNYRQHGASITAQNTPKRARAFDALYNDFFARPDLTQEARDLEKSSRFNYLVWLAWRLYYTEYFPEMAEYLQMSLPYTPYLPTETVANWTRFFREYTAGVGDELNICALKNLPEWQQILHTIAHKKTPRVSVIIPAYNCDQYIPQAIESVFNQSYSDYEIIVVNDGSKDDTAQALQPYLDRIRYYEQENQGAAIARNRALRLARGELIAFLDADDFFLPDKLARQVACFDADPTIDCVQNGWRMVDRDGKDLSDVRAWHYAPELDLKNFFLYKPVRPSAMMLRRVWCDRLGGFDSSLPPTEDLDFCLRMALFGCKAVWLKEILTCYRQHETNLMSGGLRVMKNTEILINQFLDRPDVPPEIYPLKRQEAYQRYVWFAWRMYRDGYPEAMAECLAESIRYSAFSRTENILEWVQSFRMFSAEYGYEFDAFSLLNSPEWQQATDLLMATSKI